MQWYCPQHGLCLHDPAWHSFSYRRWYVKYLRDTKGFVPHQR